MNYKIIFTDIDSTFLSSKCTVSEKNLEALRELHKMGVLVVPVTGRAHGAVIEEIRENEDIRYVISSNGACILDKETGEKSCVFLKPEAADGLSELFTRYNCFPIVHADNKVIIDNARYKKREPFGFSPYHEAYFINFSTPIDGFDEWLKSKRCEIEMTLAYFVNDEDKNAFCKEVEKIGSIHITSSSVTNTEFLDKGATKGEGIRRFAEKMGVPLSEVIAIGDSDNDVTMLKTAGLGLVVSNGCATAKAAADMVICSNDESSMYYVYKNIIKRD